MPLARRSGPPVEARPIIALVATNFCFADVNGGLGAYLPTWLAGTAGWDPLAIGSLGMASTLVFIVCSGPVGALVDRVGRPRALLVCACMMILAGSVAVMELRSFWPVLATQLIVSLGATLGTPSLLALTLGAVGKAGFAQQYGINQAADHLGNMLAALATALLSNLLFGPQAAFLVLTIMASATIASTMCIPARSTIDERARRRPAAEPRDDRSRPTVWATFRDPRLAIVAACLTLFNLGNDQMLPLLGQQQAAAGGDGSMTWMAIWILVVQLTMVPTTLVTGYLVSRFGSPAVLLASCLLLTGRAILAASTTGPLWVVAVEVLDGLGAGLISVAWPIAVTEHTYGRGHTQAAIGAIGSLSGVAAAASAFIVGAIASRAGWAAALWIMALPPVAAVLLLILFIRRSHGEA